MKIIIIVVNVLAALTAMVAALYWHKASQTNLPKIDKATGNPAGPVSLLRVGEEIVAAARFNRIAARWSGAAAALGTISVLLGSPL